MKKTWLKIRRGILTPYHRDKLGIRIWLFLYMIDRVDWETGIVHGWVDKDEAETFGMAWRTLQQQRQQLENDRYIDCYLKGQYQNIVINKWVNPREYPGSTNVNYYEYIQSAEWKQRATAAKKRAGYKCQLCNEGGALSAHHRTYERLGHERPEDIIVLCTEKCHPKFHDIIPEKP